MDKAILWEHMDARRETDPNERDICHEIVKTGEDSWSILKSIGSWDPAQVGSIERRYRRSAGEEVPFYNLEIKTNTYAVEGKTTWENLSFRRVTMIMAKWLQERDWPYQEACDPEPGERVLSGAFWTLANSYRKYPAEPKQLSKMKWLGFARAAVIATYAAEKAYNDIELNAPVWEVLPQYAGGFEGEIVAEWGSTIEAAKSMACRMEEITGESLPEEEPRPEYQTGGPSTERIIPREATSRRV